MRWLELDSNDNINISSAALIGSYTCDADRMVYATLYAQGLAGGGDYVYYATVTPSGLSEGEMLKTTQTLGATTYQLFAQTGVVTLRNGDVLKVYIDGLAGDTANPDTRVNFYELAALKPATADRTLAVDASGRVTVDDKTGYSLTVAPPTASAIADQVWNETNTDHAAAGSTGANLSAAASAGGATPASLWAYASRTLTQSAATVTAVVSGTAIAIHRGDSLSASLTGLGALTGYVSLDFTVKASKNDADSNAIIRIRKNVSGSSDGLLTLNGAAGTAAQGSITIDDAAAGNITIALDEAAADDLYPADGLYYDVQMITATTVLTKTEGICNIAADVTRAIS